jgi:hypothetical protein
MPAGVERRYMVRVDRELVEPIEERRAKAGESATFLLALPLESKISSHDSLDIGRH